MRPPEPIKFAERVIGQMKRWELRQVDLKKGHQRIA